MIDKQKDKKTERRMRQVRDRPVELLRSRLSHKIRILLTEYPITKDGLTRRERDRPTSS